MKKSLKCFIFSFTFIIQLTIGNYNSFANHPSIKPIDSGNISTTFKQTDDFKKSKYKNNYPYPLLIGEDKEIVQELEIITKFEKHKLILIGFISGSLFSILIYIFFSKAKKVRLITVRFFKPQKDKKLK